MEKSKQQVGMKFKMLFSTKTICNCVLTVLLGYATLYATNYMGLPAASVGIVFMVSKIFDGFTDFLAGIIIDHTHTKLGQARPYDLALIGYGITMILLFSAPNLGVNAGLVYLFVIYTMVNSVFSTLITCNEAPYLSNALENSEDGVRVVSFGSVISLICTLLAAVIVPQLISSIGVTKAGWRVISMCLVIPSVLVGLIRFLTIKEVRSTKVSEGQKVNIKTELKCFFGNKYIILFGIVLLLSNVCSNISSMNYYALYIIICVLMVILCAFYDLDKKLPGIREELKKRKEVEVSGRRLA